MYESGATSLTEAEYYINKSQGSKINESTADTLPNEDEKKNEIIEENGENVTENDGNLSDKSFILKRIEDYSNMLGFLDDNDRAVILERIATYKNLVNFL